MATVQPVERLTVYLPHRLNREVRLAAQRAGQSLSTYLKRTLEAHLAAQRTAEKREAQ